MKVCYTLLPEDFVALNLHICQHSPSVRQSLQRIRIFAAISAPLLALSALVLFTGPTPVALIVTFVMVVFGAAIYYGFPKRFEQHMQGQAQRLAAEQQEVKTEQQLVITPDCVLLESNLTNEQINWPALDSIVVTDAYIFLYRSSTSAIVIPKRAFADNIEQAEFVALLKQYQIN
jgi:hypothetical protein